MQRITYNDYADTVSLLSKNIFHDDNTISSVWLKSIRSAPHSMLLTSNNFRSSVSRDDQLYLVSAVQDGQDFDTISAGMGCLGNVVYCVQAYKTSDDSYTIHNFGTVVMGHRDSKSYVPFLFELGTAGLHVGEINYLRMGELFYRLSQKSEILDRPHELDEYDQYCKQVEQNCGQFVNECRRNYIDGLTATDVADAATIINGISSHIASFKSLSYVYFEAVSLALMTNSTDVRSNSLAATGEFNHQLYIELIQRLKTKVTGDMFASYEFGPTLQDLRQVFESMTVDGLLDVSPDTIALKIADNIVYYLGTCYDTEQAMMGNAFFDFCSAPANISVLRPQLDEHIAYLMAEHMRHCEYDIVINTAIEKGEIGICLNVGPRLLRIVRAAYNGNKTVIKEVQDVQARLVPVTAFAYEGTGE